MLNLSKHRNRGEFFQHDKKTSFLKYLQLTSYVAMKGIQDKKKVKMKQVAWQSALVRRSARVEAHVGARGRRMGEMPPLPHPPVKS